MNVTNGHVKPSPFILLCLYVALNATTIAVVIVLLFFVRGFTPVLLFLPIITFCAWYGGFVTGLVTTVISIISIACILFFPSHHPLLTANLTLMIELFTFFFVGAFISYIIHISKAQDRIAEYQRKLRQTHQIIETLEKNFDNAQTEIKARDQFLAIASHELKTPVTSMLLQVQTAIHNIRNVSLANFSVATLLKMLEDTEQQSRRLSKMVNDLLDLSLITTGKIDLEYEETNISQIARQVADRFATRVPDGNQLQISIQKPVICYCDKLRMEQAIINLVSNAIKYGKNQPITIEVSSTSEKAKITVSDNGIGIPVDQQKKIFNRFERAVSPRDYKGLGVGLYITYQIIKAHKGKIHLSSQVNKGSTFILEVPLKKPQK